VLFDDGLNHFENTKVTDRWMDTQAMYGRDVTAQQFPVNYHKTAAEMSKLDHIYLLILLTVIRRTSSFDTAAGFNLTPGSPTGKIATLSVNSLQKCSRGPHNGHLAPLSSTSESDLGTRNFTNWTLCGSDWRSSTLKFPWLLCSKSVNSVQNNMKFRYRKATARCSVSNEIFVNLI